jgi:hypothetical protein
MKPQEIELWARDVVDSVLNGQPVEDSRVELKAKWLEGEKAAPRLGGHANASGGENILWLIGVDERNNSLTNVDVTEKGDWYKSVEKHFDGFAPRLLIDGNFKVSGNAIVALYFDTTTEAPFVVKNPKGGFPEYIVPWRQGTGLRATKRDNLLSILVPVRRIASLIYELKFNQRIGEYVKYGYLFRESEFNKLVESGTIEALTDEIKSIVIKTYVAINIANQDSQRLLQKKEVVWTQVSLMGLDEGVVITEVNDALEKISECLDVLYKLQRN